ncbi:MAG TPA: glycosyltransferase [Dehalococcoidia bacterium]|nr:glycosyltransferase [Dehalococcoidia bacterium]
MSRTIAILSKYPPLEGGIAAKTYWIARGLAARGHEVHIITDGLDAGREYRIQGNDEPPEVLPNLWIHRPKEEIPWHIPEGDENFLTLLDLTIRMIQEHKVRVLDTGYLVPYGIIGHIAKRITGIVHVLRHGGSDIEKFLKGKVLGAVLYETINCADVVVTDERHKDLLKPMNKNLVLQPPYVVDAEAFVPREGPELKQRLAVIGKVNYHWQSKGLHHIAEIMHRLTGQFECVFVGQGKGMSDLQSTLGQEVVSNIIWKPFVPPWKMPHLLDQLDALFLFESGLPHPVVSNLAMEAMCSGVGIITDRTDFAETYEGLVAIGDEQVLVVQPVNPSLAAEEIVRWLDKRAKPRQSEGQLATYRDYLAATEALYSNILSCY